ncbi:MAG: hypothetical protein KGH65_00600 [Candidatus Micrarchaeota archaeon]|nr:hypothetical protein [Candidatus Micrarchaeota archaeon]
MKAVSVQRKKAVEGRIERKLDRITMLLEKVVKENERESNICEYCGKPVKDHKIKPEAAKRIKKWLTDYKNGKIKGTVYKDFAEFAKATS